MFGLTGVRLYAAIGAAIALALFLGWVARIDHLRGSHLTALHTLQHQADQVLVATQGAADNPTLTWEATAGQIVALGDSNQRLKVAIADQNQRIDQMAADAVKLRAKAAELKVIADKAQAQRQAALTKLSDLAITPGTRGDCLTLLHEAEEALDIVRGAGL